MMVMKLFFCAIIGFGVALGLSVWFIFPADVLNLKLVAMTVGDILRILVGLLVTLLGGGIGLLIGASKSVGWMKS